MGLALEAHFIVFLSSPGELIKIGLIETSPNIIGQRNARSPSCVACLMHANIINLHFIIISSSTLVPYNTAWARRGPAEFNRFAHSAGPYCSIAGACLRARGGIWGASWGRLGAYWGLLEGFLRASGGPLGASWGPLGASWGRLRAEGSKFPFGFPSGPPLGAVLGASWGLAGGLGGARWSEKPQM